MGSSEPNHVDAIKGITQRGSARSCDQRQAALRTVQAMIAESVRIAVVDASRELMRAVDEKLQRSLSRQPARQLAVCYLIK